MFSVARGTVRGPVWDNPRDSTWPDTLWVIGVDPGVTTGVCFAAVPADSLLGDGKSEILARFTAELTGSLSGQVSSVTRLARTLSSRTTDPPVLIVCEDFDLGGNRLTGSASCADVVTPVRIGAALQFAIECAHADESVLAFQPRTLAFTTATDARLKAWGMWDKGSDHKRDATRHVITMLRRLRQGSIDPHEVWK